jgi:hypothetical protein
MMPGDYVRSACSLCRFRATGLVTGPRNTGPELAVVPLTEASHAALTPSPYGGDGVSVQSGEAGRLACQSALYGIMHAMTSAAGQAIGMQFKISTCLMFRACLTAAIAVGQAYSAARLATYSIQDTAPFAVTAGPPR